MRGAPGGRRLLSSDERDFERLFQARRSDVVVKGVSLDEATKLTRCARALATWTAQVNTEHLVRRAMRVGLETLIFERRRRSAARPGMVARSR